LPCQDIHEFNEAPLITSARTPLEAATGKLIAAIQKEWSSELGEPPKESEQVMYACHDLLQAAKKNMLDSILGNKTITDFLGTRWVNPHPKVVPYIQDVEEARQDASQLKD
jgi:hypothetical protein